MAVGTEYYRQKILEEISNTPTSRLKLICKLMLINSTNKTDAQMRREIVDKIMKQDGTSRAILKLIIDILK